MPRGNGSYVGHTVSPTSSAASGIWTAREADRYLAAGQWPAQPAAPGTPTGTGGNALVDLTWSAASGTPTPTDYVVQYSSNGGTSWTTFSDGVSTSTSATVTGLTNGTAYIFRVQAVNALGEGPYSSASASVTPASLDVALLLHFDGPNESTIFTDSSPNAITVTAYGTAQISTAESKFGGASGDFAPENGDYLTTPEILLSSGDFTIEAWVYPTDLSGSPKAIFHNSASNGVGIVLLSNSPGTASLDFLAGTGGSWSVNIGANDALTLNAWNHVAVVRSGNNWMLFSGGVLIASTTNSFSGFDTGESFYIGRFSNGEPFTWPGYIDEFRITRAAIWTSGFTPPTAPY